jgi:hypothetical protein
LSTISACACASIGRTEYAFGAGQRQGGDLPTQLFARAVGLLLDLRLRRGLDTLGLNRRRILGFFDNLAGAAVGGLDDARGFFLGLAQALDGFFLGQLEVLAGLVRRREPFGNLALTLLHGGQDRRPDVAHAENHEGHEGQHLADQGKVNVHDLLLAKIRWRTMPPWTMASRIKRRHPVRQRRSGTWRYPRR